MIIVSENERGMVNLSQDPEPYEQRMTNFIVIFRVSGSVHIRLYLSDSYRLIVTNVIENAKLLRGLEGLDKIPDS